MSSNNIAFLGHVPKLSINKSERYTITGEILPCLTMIARLKDIKFTFLTDNYIANCMYNIWATGSLNILSDESTFIKYAEESMSIVNSREDPFDFYHYYYTEYVEKGVTKENSIKFFVDSILFSRKYNIDPIYTTDKETYDRVKDNISKNKEKARSRIKHAYLDFARRKEKGKDKDAKFTFSFVNTYSDVSPFDAFPFSRVLFDHTPVSCIFRYLPDVLDQFYRSEDSCMFCLFFDIEIPGHQKSNISVYEVSGFENNKMMEYVKKYSNKENVSIVTSPIHRGWYSLEYIKILEDIKPKNRVNIAYADSSGLNPFVLFDC